MYLQKRKETMSQSARTPKLGQNILLNQPRTSNLKIWLNFDLRQQDRKNYSAYWIWHFLQLLSLRHLRVHRLNRQGKTEQPNWVKNAGLNRNQYELQCSLDYCWKTRRNWLNLRQKKIAGKLPWFSSFFSKKNRQIVSKSKYVVVPSLKFRSHFFLAVAVVWPRLSFTLRCADWLQGSLQQKSVFDFRVVNLFIECSNVVFRQKSGKFEFLFKNTLVSRETITSFLII